MTFHRVINYGAVLQAFALQRALSKCDNSCEVKMIDYRCPSLEDPYDPWKWNKEWGFVKRILRLGISFPAKYKKRKAFRAFSDKYISMTSYSVSHDDRPMLNDKFDAFISGSDQVFNRSVAKNDETYFLDFVEDDKLKYSYAASFGTFDRYEFCEDRNLELLNRFTRVSLREMIRSTEKNADNRKHWRIDVDPTLLLSASEWEKIRVAPKTTRPYILVYTVQVPRHLMNFARELSKAQNLPILYINDGHLDDRDMKHIRARGPAEFLGYIANAACVVTASFHAVVFSILFHKKFYVELDNDTQHNERIENLLNTVGISDRAIESNNLAPYDGEIAWANVDHRLDEERKKSLVYLNEIIQQIK